MLLYLLSVLIFLPIVFLLNKRYLINISGKENIISIIFISLFSYALVYNNAGYEAEHIYLYMIYSLMLLLSFIDYKKMSIPDELNVTLFIISTIYTFLFLGVDNLAFGMQLLGIFTAIWFITEYIFKREIFGLGDLLYISILGYLINDTLSIVYIFLISSFVAIPISLLSIKLLNKKEIPYLPFITIAFVIEHTLEISKI